MQSYDPLHRNPLFCGADHTTLWELQMVRTDKRYKVCFFFKTVKITTKCLKCKTLDIIQFKTFYMKEIVLFYSLYQRH